MALAAEELSAEQIEALYDKTGPNPLGPEQTRLNTAYNAHIASEFHDLSLSQR